MLVTVTMNQSGDFVTHKAGCQHLNRLRSPYNPVETFEAANAREVVERVWTHQIRESGESAESYVPYMDYAPCLRNLPVS